VGIALALAAQPLISVLVPGRVHPVAVPDSLGELQHIVVHYTSAASELITPTYADFFGTLPAEVRVAVAVERQEHYDELVERLAGLGVTHPGLHPVVTGYAITPWSRDRYTLARLGERWLLVVPERSDGAVAERQNDWRVPWALAEALAATEVATIPLRFDGGDLLTTERYVLASYRLVEKNLGTLVRTRGELVGELERAFGREVFVFGDAPRQVPIHHIGMYVTPLPDGRFALGDPRLGLALAGPERAATLGADVSEASLARFEAVAEAFVAAGLEVVRLPLLPLEGELDYVTYNNVVMETRGGETTVWVPVYGVPELDEAGLQAWRTLGVTVRPVDVSRIYRYDGSLRCLVNVLRRG
jgi:hypothetical protein